MLTCYVRTFFFEILNKVNVAWKSGMNPVMTDGYWKVKEMTRICKSYMLNDDLSRKAEIKRLQLRKKITWHLLVVEAESPIPYNLCLSSYFFSGKSPIQSSLIEIKSSHYFLT